MTRHDGSGTSLITWGTHSCYDGFEMLPCFDNYYSVIWDWPPLGTATASVTDCQSGTSTQMNCSLMASWRIRRKWRRRFWGSLGLLLKMMLCLLMLYFNHYKLVGRVTKISVKNVSLKILESDLLFWAKLLRLFCIFFFASNTEYLISKFCFM